MNAPYAKSGDLVPANDEQPSPNENPRLSENAAPYAILI